MKFGPKFKKTFYRRKKKPANRVSILKYASSRPSNYFYKMPSVFRVSMDHVYQINSTAQAGAYDGQYRALLTLLSPDNTYPPYFTSLMRIYSTCYVRRAQVQLKFVALELANQANMLAIGCGIISTRDAQEMVGNISYMNKIRALPGAQSAYLSGGNGGHDVVTFTHNVDFDKYVETANDYTYAYRSHFNAAGQQQLTPPDVDATRQSPAVVFSASPTLAGATGTFNYQFVVHLTYSLEFSGLHLGSFLTT